MVSSHGASSLFIMISIYPSKNVSYESKYSLSESAARLSDKVKKNNLRNRLTGGILGDVEACKVTLRYFDPWKIFSGGIQFEGSFMEKNGSTLLIGRFKASNFSRIFSVSWLVITIILFCYSLIKVELLAVAIFMFIPWIATILIVRRWSNTDIEHVTRTIDDSLR